MVLKPLSSLIRNGVLRRIIRDYLRQQPEVASVADEDIQRGGDGATVVVLKG